jgi:hypothetical protein
MAQELPAGAGYPEGFDVMFDYPAYRQPVCSTQSVLAGPARSPPHGCGNAGRIATGAYSYTAASGDWRHDRVSSEQVWPKAIHRVAADGISPEHAVDEAIARIKQILSE